MLFLLGRDFPISTRCTAPERHGRARTVSGKPEQRPASVITPAAETQTAADAAASRNLDVTSPRTPMVRPSAKPKA
jgi:hypothetical protein